MKYAGHFAAFGLMLCNSIANAEPVKTPAVKPVKHGKVQYATIKRERPCPPASAEEAKKPTTLNSVIPMCGYSFGLQATAVDNGELVWENVMYARAYNLEKDRESQIIYPTSLKIKKGISAIVKNQKGDEFVVWLERGYLTKPTQPKEYPVLK